MNIPWLNVLLSFWFQFKRADQKCHFGERLHEEPGHGPDQGDSGVHVPSGIQKEQPDYQGG